MKELRIRSDLPIIKTSGSNVFPSGSDRVLCCYVNPSDRHQIVRITNISNLYLERSVAPGQKLLFEAPARAKLEIHTSNLVGSILSDRIPCKHLQLDKENPQVILTVTQREVDLGGLRRTRNDERAEN